jgi:hypothetical protein
MSAAGDLRKLKRAELDQPTRIQLRTKIGYFFSRAIEDLPDDEKVDAPESVDELE